jgi:hypothetical protein
MAGERFTHVIYIIIAGKMKTIHNTSKAQNKSHIRARVRSVLTVVGIITAIICSVVLLQDSHSAERAEVGVPNLMEASRFITADVLANVGSTIWSVR